MIRPAKHGRALKKLVTMWCALSALALWSGRSYAAQELLYFDPDANHQAIVAIQNIVSSYLQARGVTLVFQPVQRRAKFNELLSGGKPMAAIVASTVLKDIKPNRLRILLVPTSGGSMYYRKRLVDRSVSGSFVGKTIATAMSDSSAESQQRALQDFRKAGVLPNVTLIPVAKDIDGLLALSFGQVDGAVVTQSSIDVLKRLNPAAAANIRIVYETSDILRSPLVSFGLSTEYEKKLTDAFADMARDPRGLQALQIMGFDGWAPAPVGGMQ